MGEADVPLVGRWTHSFEEDHDDIRVYRPPDFDFPRARGRGGLEFRADGTFVDFAIGPTDANTALEGSWLARSEDKVRVITSEGRQRELRIVHAAPDRLEVRVKEEP